MNKFEAFLVDLKSASDRLAEALAVPKDEFLRDSCIKRFELCFELSWKAMKDYLSEMEGLELASPGSVIREAFQTDLIKDEEGWFRLLKLRNETTHAYDEDLAESIYAKLPEALRYFQELLVALQEKQSSL